MTLCDFDPCEEPATHEAVVTRQLETGASCDATTVPYCAHHLDLAERVGAVQSSSEIE